MTSEYILPSWAPRISVSDIKLSMIRGGRESIWSVRKGTYHCNQCRQACEDCSVRISGSDISRYMGRFYMEAALQKRIRMAEGFRMLLLSRLCVTTIRSVKEAAIKKYIEQSEESRREDTP